MTNLRRQYGFWAAVSHLNLGDLRSPEFSFGALLGAGGAITLHYVTDVEGRIRVAADYLTLSSALLGVVFAGFALVIALLSDSYLRFLNLTKSGVAGFLRPFILATGLQVSAVLGSIIYRAAADLVPGRVESWLFGILSVLFCIALLDIVALARSVMLHGIARARSAEIPDIQEHRTRSRDTK